MMGEILAKSDARRVVRTRLDKISDGNYRSSNEVIIYHVTRFMLSLAQSNSVKSVLSYQAHIPWKEIDLTEVEGALPQLTFIYVPREINAEFPLGPYDVIFVPLFGWNDACYRLGRGGGWYDKLLAFHRSAHKIGVGLTAGRIDFQTEPHDIPMDLIITEAGILAKNSTR